MDKITRNIATDILLENGYQNVNTRGSQFIITAMILYDYNKHKRATDLYQAVADLYNTNIINVQRQIKYSLDANGKGALKPFSHITIMSRLYKERIGR